MSTSIFLAQLIGLYLVLTNLAALIHQARWKKMVTDCLGSSLLIATWGSLSLLFGLLILLSHNTWTASWPIVVTIIGWIVLLQGVFRLFMPHQFIKLAKDLVANQGCLLISWAWLIVGVYLIWAGFTQHR